MTVYCYDTEFLEDGNTIELISIGIVCEDGREYYAVNADMPELLITQHDWLRENVWPHLPLLKTHVETFGGQVIRENLRTSRLDRSDIHVKPKSLIAEEVRRFFRTPIELGGIQLICDDGGPELWAYYGAYDHVALAQLWGPMVDLPAGIPMFTHDIMQELSRRGLAGVDLATVVPRVSHKHHALADAQWNMQVLNALRAPSHLRPIGLLGASAERA